MLIFLGMSRRRWLPALLCLGLAWSSPSPEKRYFRFRMYHNPPKPTCALLPVQSRKLEKPAREMFNQAFAKEAVKLDCKVTPLPEDIRLDTFGQLPPEALPELKERRHIDLIVQTRLEQAVDRNALYAEIIDTRSGAIKASFNQDCQCQLGELFLWMVPEAVRRLGFAMHVRPPTCPLSMALIPAPVKAGEPDSTGKAWGPGAFCVDLYEFPNTSGVGPVSGMSWKEAEGLCKSKGKRLCNEEEWKLACGGWDRLTYPYGEKYDKRMCNTESETIQLSGGHSACESPFGVFDLSGNLYEWTSSPWNSKVKDKVVHGGNWNAGPNNSRCQDRFAQPPDSPSPAIGVRCCSEPQR
jgi:hypothetical protein